MSLRCHDDLVMLIITTYFCNHMRNAFSYFAIISATVIQDNDIIKDTKTGGEDQMFSCRENCSILTLNLVYQIFKL